MRDQSVKIAVIADIHYGEDHQPVSRRRCGIADLLLRRAVRRLNLLVRPDVVLVLGDLVDDGSAADVSGRWERLKGILDGLDAPYLTLPGNHDDDPDALYRVFERPKPFEDIAGVRFLAFADQEEPGYNASRSKADIERIRAARQGFDGPIVSLQHVCLFPPELGRVAPYNYLNADEIIETLKRVGAVLSVSGHHHHGADTVKEGSVTFVNAPGLCESPFHFLEISLSGDEVETVRHELTMPSDLGLVDNHVHTELAYCAENMDVKTSIALCRDFGLAGMTFAEHAGQLYYDRKPYWQAEWLEAGVDGADPASNRMQQYLARKREFEDNFARFSLEVECDAKGRLVLPPQDAEEMGPLLGTVHAVPGLSKETPPTQDHEDAFLYLVDALGRQGVRGLAHPLRIFRRTGWETPVSLYEKTAKLLRKYEVAAELNFHSNDPAVAFVKCCLDHGVKFSFGSDAHCLSELGDFAYHLDLLRRAGFDGDLRDVVIGHLE